MKIPGLIPGLIPGHSVYKVLMGQMGDSICAGESEARPVFTSVLQEQRPSPLETSEPNPPAQIPTPAKYIRNYQWGQFYPSGAAGGVTLWCFRITWIFVPWRAEKGRGYNSGIMRVVSDKT